MVLPDVDGQLSVDGRSAEFRRLQFRDGLSAELKTPVKDSMGKIEHSLYFLLSEVKDLRSPIPSLLLPSPFTLFVRMLLYFLVEGVGDK